MGWAGARAAFVAFHVCSVVVLALPGSIGSKSLQSAGAKADMHDWATQARELGLEEDPAAFETRLLDAAASYGEARKFVTAPFGVYADLTASKQGWAMFATPQRHPAELHIEGRVGSEWRLLYRPHDEAANLLSDYLRHNRIRKFQGRFARRTRAGAYEGFAAFLAKRVFEERAEVEEVRISLLRYASLAPERVRAGQRPAWRREQTMVFQRSTVNQ